MADLHFTEKDPSKGYINSNLLIPKEQVNLTALRAALSFVIGEEQIIEEDTNQLLGTRPKIEELFSETAHHVIVPRAFLSEEAKKDFGFEWVDETADLELTRVNLPDHIVPRDKSQFLALEAMARHRGGTVNLACGRGKTVVALKYAVTKNVPVMVVVNTAALVHQWEMEIRQHVSKKVKIGRIQGKEARWKGCPIVIATVQTLANRHDEWPQEFRQRFGVIFYDEGHHLSAPHFVKSADLFYGERFSLTATATRTDGLEAIYQYHLGPIIYADLKQDLIPDTVFHEMKWEPDEDQDQASRGVNGLRHHGLLCIMLGTVEWRTRRIVRNLIRDMKEGREVLVLTHSVDHTRELLRLYEKAGGPGTPGVINGEDVEPVDRIPTLLAANPVIASFQLAREALNKQVLDTLHVCTPFGNSNDLQQAWGRIQRKKETTRTTRVRVYVDTEIPTCRKQCQKLKKYLKALKYPMKTIQEKT